jgi:hypothetical protein
MPVNYYSRTDKHTATISGQKTGNSRSALRSLARINQQHTVRDMLVTQAQIIKNICFRSLPHRVAGRRCPGLSCCFRDSFEMASFVGSVAMAHRLALRKLFRGPLSR